MTEEILIKVELDKPEADKQVNELSKSITTLTTENKNLIATNKELEKQGKANSKEYLENTKQIEINKQKINENNSSRKNLIQAIIAEDNSIKGLQIRNRELVQQRNLISTATEEGREAIKKINEEIDKNNAIIKENSSGLEKQRLNVGNYTESIKDAAGQLGGIAPGISGFISGIQGMTKASLAFIATPIGAIIGAIGLALSALTAYFKGSEDGQNKLNKIMQVGSAIMGKVMDVVRDLGEAIFTAFTNPKQALTDFVDLIKNNIQNRIEGLLELFPKLGQTIELVFKGKFAEAGQVAFDAIAKVTTGVEDATSKVIGLFNEVQKTVDLALSQGLKVANLQELLRQKEREYEIESAKTFLRVSELKLKAEQTVGEERRKAVSEAIALEQKLADKTVKLAQIRYNLAKQEADIADNDIEANNALIKAEADLIRAKADRFNTVKELTTKLFAVENEIRKQEDAARIAEEDALIAQLEKEIAQIEEFETLKNETFRQIEDSFRAEQRKKEQQRLDESLAAQKKYTNAVIALKQMEAQEAIKLSGILQGLFASDNGVSKTFGLLQIGINSAVGVSNAVKAGSGIPWPGNLAAILSGISAVLAGIGQAKSLLTGFATGGSLRSSMGIPIQRSNGDDRLITAKVGETILTREQTARIGTSRLAAAGVPGFATGGIVGNETRIAAGQAESQFDINRLAGLINGVQPVLVYQDFEIAQDNILGTRNRAQVI